MTNASPEVAVLVVITPCISVIALIRHAVTAAYLRIIHKTFGTYVNCSICCAACANLLLLLQLIDVVNRWQCTLNTLPKARRYGYPHTAAVEDLAAMFAHNA